MSEILARLIVVLVNTVLCSFTMYWILSLVHKKKISEIHKEDKDPVIIAAFTSAMNVCGASFLLAAAVSVEAVIIYHLIRALINKDFTGPNRFKF